MKPRTLIIAFLFLPIAALTPTSQAALGTTWDLEVPGVSEGVSDIQMQGDADKQGIAYELKTSGTLGFLVRTAEDTYSIKTSDVSGNSTDLQDPDLCYIGGSSWDLIAAPAGSDDVWYYRSTNDGANWSHDFTLNGVPSGHALGCYGDTRGILGTNTTNEAVWYNRSLDAGATWSPSGDLNDDDGSPTGTGSSVGTLGGKVNIAFLDESNAVVNYGGASCRVHGVTTDDGGAFWTVPNVAGVWDNPDAFCSRVRGIGVTSIGGGEWATVAGTDGGTGGGAEDAFVFFNNDDTTQVGMGVGQIKAINSGCGSNPCNFASNTAGQLLAYAQFDRSPYFSDGQGFGFTEQAINSNGDDVNQATVFLLDDTAFFLYADADQGDRLEVYRTDVFTPTLTYTNPNGNDWGDVRTNWDLEDPEVYAKELFEGDDEDQGNIFRFAPDLSLQNRWDACPEVKYVTAALVIASSMDETIGIHGNLGVDPVAGGQVYSACHDDFFNTDEFYSLRAFTGNGVYLGYTEINDVTWVNDPTWLESSGPRNVFVAHFYQTNPINISLVDADSVATTQRLHDQDRGTLWNDEHPGLVAIGSEPLASVSEDSRFYSMGDTTGTGLSASFPSDLDEASWISASSQGDAFAAYDGDIWWVNEAGTEVTRVIDGGSSFSVAETAAMVTQITPFLQQMRVTKDGAYLIAQCATNDVCLYNSTDYSLVYTATVPTGSIMYYDVDITNSWLYVARDDTIYGYDLTSQTSAFGDEENCIDISVCAEVTAPEEEDDTLGPDGVGGEEGGFIGEPGTGVPGLSSDAFDDIAADLGISASALAWFLGIILTMFIGVGLGAAPMATGGAFNVPLAVLGALMGMGLSTAFSLFPVWFVVVVALVGSGLLVVGLRRG